MFPASYHSRSTSRKREESREDGDGERPKRIKQEMEESDYASEEKVTKLTIPVLKEWLIAKGVEFKAAMKKPDLVKLVVNKAAESFGP